MIATPDRILLPAAALYQSIDLRRFASLAVFQQKALHLFAQCMSFRSPAELHLQALCSVVNEQEMK